MIMPALPHRSGNGSSTLLVGAVLLCLAACDTGYIADDPDAAMRKETAPAPDGSLCGDGAVSEFGDEVCDGDDLNEQTCESQGLPAGTLRCTEFCDAFDTSQCVGEGECGNGILDEGEACEPIAGEGCAYGDEDCEICLSTCQFGPGPVQFCGDDVLQPREESCDGSAENFETCEGFGFVGGTLSCDANCELDTSTCEGAQCGDGVLEGEEECEPDETNQACAYGEPCQICGETCKLVDGDYPFCGDFLLQPEFEACDGGVTETCASLGLGEGTVTCDDACALDTSACDDTADAGADIDETDASGDAGETDATGSADAADAGSEDAGGDGSAQPPEDESGCSTGAALPGLSWTLAALLGLRRRRRATTRRN